MIEEIAGCGADLLRLTKPPLSDRIWQQLAHLGQITLRIAVVGQIKAGKSSFINALSGRPNYLPTHVNPWTAVPTKLYFGVRNKPISGALFEFFSEREWDRLGRPVTAPIGRDIASATAHDLETDRTAWRRTILRIGHQFHHLLGSAHRYETISPKTLAYYLCAGPPIERQSRHFEPGRYADITKVAHIFLPGDPFDWPTILIDTPGLNDPSFIRIKTTLNILEHADIYIVVLSASQPMSLADITLLQRLRGLEKRRILIFINRIDELPGGAADIDVVEAHVREKLRGEFPEAEVSILSGSAYWASIAVEGSAATVQKLRSSAAFGHMLRRAGAVPGAPEDLDDMRMRILEASGIPALICALSDLMIASFLSADGSKLVETWKSAAEFSVSAARRELVSLQQMIESTQSGDETAGFNHAIAQLEKRLSDTELLKGSIASIVEDVRKQIGRIQEDHIVSIRLEVERVVRAFAREQRTILASNLGQARARTWTCDVGELVQRIEEAFIALFTAALEQIEAAHDNCIGTVRDYLEQSHAPEQPRALKARLAAQPDIRHALPALGLTIEVEIGGPWWSGWWRSDRSPEEKAGDLEQKIFTEFLPVAERLAAFASNELAAVAEHASAAVSDTAKSTISGTTARLMDLKHRISAHVERGQLQKLEAFNRDYATSFRDLTSLKSDCEEVIARLERVEARQTS